MKRWVAVTALLLLGCGLAVAAQPPRTQQASEHTLGEGLTLLHRAQTSSDHAAAMRLYRAALLDLNQLATADGIHNAGLYYDLGILYYHLGEIGRSILSYRRAMLYGPPPAGLAQNLALARSKRADHLPIHGSSGLLRLLFFWHYRLSLETQALLFALGCGLLWGGLIVLRVTGRRWLRWPSAAAGFLAVMMLGSLAWTQLARSSERSGVIVAAQVTARSGDALSYEAALSTPLHAGTEFQLRSVRTGWYDIELTNGVRAWIPSGAARLVRPRATRGARSAG